MRKASSLTLLVACLAAVLAEVDVGKKKVHEPPSYDHQTTTYHSVAQPRTCTGTSKAVTPFFSPDSSIQTYVSLIEEATESIDLYAPGKPCCNCKHLLRSSRQVGSAGLW